MYVRYWETYLYTCKLLPYPNVCIDVAPGPVSGSASAGSSLWNRLPRCLVHHPLWQSFFIFFITRYPDFSQDLQFLHRGASERLMLREALYKWTNAIQYNKRWLGGPVLGHSGNVQNYTDNFSSTLIRLGSPCIICDLVTKKLHWIKLRCIPFYPYRFICIIFPNTTLSGYIGPIATTESFLFCDWSENYGTGFPRL